MKMDITPSPITQSQVRILRRWSDMKAIAHAWCDLHQRAGGSLFSSFEWLAAQQETFANNGHPHVVTIWRDERLVAAAPLRLIRAPVSKHLPRLKVQTLSYMSCSYTAYFDLLHVDAAAGEALAGVIAGTASGRVIDLEMMPQAPVTDLLCRRLHDAGHRLDRIQRFESTVIDGRQDYQSYLAGRKGSFRKSLRKACRALEDLGAKYEMVDGADPQVQARLFAISQKSWKHRVGMGIASRGDHRQFSARMLSGRTAPTQAVCGLISIPQGDIALCIWLLRAGICYGLWTEFDEAYDKLSPGRTIITWMMRDLMARGTVQRFDFLRKTHFTETFSDDGYVLDRITACPRHGVARLVQDMERLAKRSLGKMRAGKRKSPRRVDVLDITGEKGKHDDS